MYVLGARGSGRIEVIDGVSIVHLLSLADGTGARIAARSRPWSTGRPAPRRCSPRTYKSRGGSKRRRSPVPASVRDQQVVAAIRDRPGIRVPELGQSLNVHYTGLYRVVT